MQLSRETSYSFHSVLSPSDASYAEGDLYPSLKAERLVQASLTVSHSAAQVREQQKVFLLWCKRTLADQLRPTLDIEVAVVTNPLLVDGQAQSFIPAHDTQEAGSSPRGVQLLVATADPSNVPVRGERLLLYLQVDRPFDLARARPTRREQSPEIGRDRCQHGHELV